MFTEIGLPLLAAFFLEINALVLIVMIAAFLCHEATALWDVSYAVTRREVTPWEQHVHSFLEMIPLMGILLVIALHADRLAQPTFGLALKATPLPLSYLVPLGCAILLFTVWPYANELLRCVKAGRESPRP